MGGRGWSRTSSSAGRSFPRPRQALHTQPPRPSDASVRTLPPRRGGPRKRGRASAPSGQWGWGLQSGAGRPRHDAPSGGCFKMADVVGPSRPGAAAFWSRDCILCPPGRGRRRLPVWRAASGRVGPSGGASSVLTWGRGRPVPPRSRGRAFRLAWELGGRVPDTVSRLGFQGFPSPPWRRALERWPRVVAHPGLGGYPSPGDLRPAGVVSLWRREGCWVIRAPLCPVLALSLVRDV